MRSAERVSILRKLRLVLGLFTAALILSGLTAFPLKSEMEHVVAIRGLEHMAPAEAGNGFDRWILTIRNGLRESYARYPWLAYGTDWLAFAHLVIAVFFTGAFIDSVRNVWILQAGIIACVLVVPFALGMGAARGIPIGWRLIDCSFGVLGIIPLWLCRREIQALARLATPAR